MVTNITETCPYKGLRPYTEDDRKYFFGRERDKEVIASNLYVAPLTILYGTSGVGKSSVLQAGAIPQLRTEQRVGVVYFNQWQGDSFDLTLKKLTLEEVCRCAGVSPSEALERMRETLEQDGGQRGRSARATDGPPLIETITFDNLLLGCARGFRLRLLLVFDQFEEYFLYHTPSTSSEGFDAEFARAVNQQESGVNFMLSMREEDLSKLDRFRQRIPNLLSNLLRLENLDRRSARRAIIKPLKVYNGEQSNGSRKSIETGLVREILKQVNPAALPDDKGVQTQAASQQRAAGTELKIETPFLQLVLTRLWEEEWRLGSNKLRLSTLEALGGAKNIARTHLDEVMGKLSVEDRQTAASVLRFLVTPTGTKIAQQPSSLALWAEVGLANVRQVLTDLSSKQDMCILRKVSVPNQEERYELFHDVLGPAILDWVGRYVQERRLASQREKAEREIRSAQRRASRLRWGLISAGVLLLLMTGLTVFAFQQRGEAKRQKAEADKQNGEAVRQGDIAKKALGRVEETNNDLIAEKKNVETERDRAKEQKEEALRAKEKEEDARRLAEAQKRRADSQALIAGNAARIDKASRLALIAEKSGDYNEAIERLNELEQLYKGSNNASGRAGAFLNIADNHLYQNQMGPLMLFLLEATELEADDEHSDTGQVLLAFLPLLAMGGQFDMLERDEKEMIDELTITRNNILKNLDLASQANQSTTGADHFRNEAEIQKRRGDLQMFSAMIRELGAKETGKGKDKEIDSLALEELTFYYNKASEAYEKAGAFDAEAKMQKKIGFLLSTDLKEKHKSGSSDDEGKADEEDEGKYRDAVERVVGYYKRAGESFARAGKPLKQASMYARIGAFYKDLSADCPDRISNAILFYNSALTIYQKEKKADREADTAIILGDLLTESGKDEKHVKPAIAFYEEARQAYGRVASQRRSGRETFLSKQSEALKKVHALLLSSGGGESKVEEYFGKVIKDYENDFTGKARTLGMIAELYKGSDKKKALDYYKQERDAWRSAKNLKEEGDVLFDIGKLYTPSDSETGYVEWFEAARDVYRKIDARAVDDEGKLIRPQLASNLNWIGKAYDSNRRKEMAADAYEEALQAYTSSETATTNFYNLGSIVQACGGIYLSWKDERGEQKAREMFQRVVAYYQTKKDAAGEASMLVTIGEIYRVKEKREEAIKYYEQALPIYEKSKNVYSAMTTLKTIGSIYEAQGEKGKSLVDYYKRVAESSRQNNRVREALALEALGNYYRETKQNQEALAQYKQARQAYDAAGLFSQEISVLRTMSSIYSELGDKPTADEMIKLANELSSKVR